LDKNVEHGQPLYAWARCEGEYEGQSGCGGALPDMQQEGQARTFARPPADTLLYDCRVQPVKNLLR
jgi:hypothetical protein